MTTETCEREDRRADAGLGDPCPERVDHTRCFVAHHAGRLGGIGVEPLASHELGEVEAAGAHANSNLATLRRGIGLLADLQHVGAAVLLDPDRTHAEERRSHEARAPRDPRPLLAEGRTSGLLAVVVSLLLGGGRRGRGLVRGSRLGRLGRRRRQRGTLGGRLYGRDLKGGCGTRRTRSRCFG